MLTKSHKPVTWFDASSVKRATTTRFPPRPLRLESSERHELELIFYASRGGRYRQTVSHP